MLYLVNARSAIMNAKWRKGEIKMKYYYLKKDEIIKEGDECEVSAKWNDEPKWVDAGHTVGRKAPDPQYIAHRKYRRKIKD